MNARCAMMTRDTVLAMFKLTCHATPEAVHLYFQRSILRLRIGIRRHSSYMDYIVVQQNRSANDWRQPKVPRAASSIRHGTAHIRRWG